MAGILGKHQIEKALAEEKKDITTGRLKEDNPLDTTEDFRRLCEAARRGDLRVCQEQLQKGVNINARDEYDYTPLILASLCGHYEVVQMLLDQGALCERDSFVGERTLYNALNDRIRNLLLQYDYSKSTDPLQPLAAHITHLLTRDHPRTGDIAVYTGDTRLDLHKFVLSARSPYFANKLAAAPQTTSWKLANSIPGPSFETCIKYLYMGDVDASLGDGEEEQAILTGIDKLSRQLEIPRLFDNLLQSGDRRLARQRRTEEMERGATQLADWFEANVVRHKLEVDASKADGVKWDRDNGIFADVLLRADTDEEEDIRDAAKTEATARVLDGPRSAIPIGHFHDATSRSPSRGRKIKKAVLFPCHRAMLLRSEVFSAMFASPFREGQRTAHLQIVPVDCSPEVLEVVLRFLYTEKADFPLSIALDVLIAADMLFIEKLKQRAALLISTLGNGTASIVEADNSRGKADVEEVVNIYDVLRAGWDTRVHRLEEFAARFIAFRLEQYIDEEEFKDLVRESADRIQSRQETDTVELIDDIRYWLSERFRLRFEDAGFDELEERAANDDESTRDEYQKPNEDEGYAGSPPEGLKNEQAHGEDDEAHVVIRTLDGEIAGDEFAQDAMNYQILLGKIDRLMEDLGLDG